MKCLDEKYIREFFDKIVHAAFGYGVWSMTDVRAEECDDLFFEFISKIQTDARKKGLNPNDPDA